MRGCVEIWSVVRSRGRGIDFDGGRGASVRPSPRRTSPSQRSSYFSVRISTDRFHSLCAKDKSVRTTTKFQSGLKGDPEPSPRRLWTRELVT
ncbi:hypothetical protein SLE2022_313410 [Rubroshorea leprosula]